jgi:hypothetical protein
VKWEELGVQRGYARIEVECAPAECRARVEGWGVSMGGAIHTTLTCGRVSGVVEQLKAGKWTLEFSLPGQLDGSAGQPTLRAVAMVSPTAGWAAGALAHRSRGGDEAPGSFCTATSYTMHVSEGGWTVVPVPNVGTINGLAFDSPDDGWAAADGGCCTTMTERGPRCLRSGPTRAQSAEQAGTLQASVIRRCSVQLHSRGHATMDSP